MDYSRDFFGRPAYLTVSGQMQGEFFATALSNVYTFGPTFRAEGERQCAFEHSLSARHGMDHLKTQSNSQSAGTCPSCCLQRKASSEPITHMRFACSPSLQKQHSSHVTPSWQMLCNAWCQLTPAALPADSHTSRHLAEFWMIEPEMAFCTLDDDMNCAEDYVRFCCQHLLDHHQ